MSDELLPCPFCGGEPELDWINEAGEVLTAWVSCKCGCEHHERLTKEVAVKKWNSRCIPNDAQAPMDREEIAKIIAPELYGSPMAYPQNIESDEDLNFRRNQALNQADAILALPSADRATP